MIDVSDELLDHPMRLRLYLYIRSKSTPVGIRETQRELEINSASSVRWHLDKLVEARYLVRNPDTRYQLNGNHELERSITVPIEITVKHVKNSLVSPYAFIQTFLTVMFLGTVLIWVFLRDPLFIGITGAISILVALATVIYINRAIQLQLSQLLGPLTIVD